MKQSSKRFVLWLRDCVEIYIPVVAFCALFAVFIMQVFCRYILRDPKSWSLEVTAICYVWVVLLGACFAQRQKSHVTFTLFYDMLPVKGKAISAFLGNLIIAAALAISFMPTWEYIKFMEVQKSSVLKISLNLVYAPYMVFLALMLMYIIIEMYQDFMVFSGRGNAQAEQRLLDENQNVWQKAIEETLKEEPQ